MNADYSSFTILAVDDNEQNLMVLEHLLHKTKVKMETVMDGNTAVQKCEAGKTGHTGDYAAEIS